MNLKGCKVQEIGRSISAAPRTEPFAVRKINFTREPRSSCFETQSSPPVSEITRSLPRTREPLWERRTVGVFSVKVVRGARLAAGVGGGGSIWVVRVCELPWAVGRLRKGLVRIRRKVR